MGKIHLAIDDSLRAWIDRQHLFFVASAPSGDAGHVNCSPRGGNALRVIGPTTIAWQDRVGSGIETIAHVQQNGRLVVMLCAFEGPPRIVRLHGRGHVAEAGSREFTAMMAHFDGPWLGVRAIVRVELTRISDSCGFGVPLYRYEGERDQMYQWAEKKGELGVTGYVRDKNATSIDGLPGLHR